MSRWVIAVDPGASTGIALFEGERFVSAITSDGASFLALNDSIRKLIEPHGFMANKTAVIEAGFFSVNRATALVLERRRGLVQAACEINGFSTCDLYPSQWQSKVLRHLGDGGGVGRPKRVELKKRSLMRAREITGEAVASVDVADAICMGFCFTKSLHLPGSS